MRREIKEEKQITREVVVEVETSCDLCGYGTDPDDDQDYIFDVSFAIASEGCAPTRIERDVCQWCYNNVLSKHFDELFKAVNAGDPILTEHHEDRWYG